MWVFSRFQWAHWADFRNVLCGAHLHPPTRKKRVGGLPNPLGGWEGDPPPAFFLGPCAPGSLPAMGGTAANPAPRPPQPIPTSPHVPAPAVAGRGGAKKGAGPVGQAPGQSGGHSPRARARGRTRKHAAGPVRSGPRKASGPGVGRLQGHGLLGVARFRPTGPLQFRKQTLNEGSAGSRVFRG